MGLETAVYVKDLNLANPTGGDTRRQGDDHLRMFKGAVQRTLDRIQPKIHTGGTGAAYTLSTGHAGATLEVGGLYGCIFHTASLDNATMNVDGTGVKPLYKPMSGGHVAVAANDYPAGGRVLFHFDGNAFVILTVPYQLSYFPLTGGVLSGNLHVQVGGMALIHAQTTGPGQQARLGIQTNSSQWLWYTNEPTAHCAFWNGVDRLRLHGSGEVEVMTSALIPNGGIAHIGGISSFSLSNESGNAVMRYNNAGWLHYVPPTHDSFRWALGGHGETGWLDHTGFRSRSNAKVWLRAGGGTLFNGFNVSSLQYFGAGTYVVHFARALPNNVYATVGMGEQFGPNPPYAIYHNGPNHGNTAVGIALARPDGTRGDVQWALAVFGDGV